MTIRIACECGKQLQVKDEMEGKRVRCPACQQVLLVANAPVSVPKVKPEAAKATAALPGGRDEEDDAAGEEDRPRPARGKRKRVRKEKGGPNVALWLGVGGVAVLVLVAAVVTLVLVRSRKPKTEQAANPGPTPVAPGAPPGSPAPGVQPGRPVPFLDQEKEVPARLEWSREMASNRGGTISFRVTSQGPFAVSVVTGKGFQAITAGNRQGFRKEDLLLTVDSKGPSLEGKVTVPAGRFYFIIENQTDRAARIHLQCYDANP